MGVLHHVQPRIHRQFNIPSGAVVVVVAGGIAGDGTGHGDAGASDGGSGEQHDVCDIPRQCSVQRPPYGMVIRCLGVNVKVQQLCATSGVSGEQVVSMGAMHGVPSS